MTNTRTDGRGHYLEIVELIEQREKARGQGDDATAESIDEQIYDMPLTVSVRDGWHPPGSVSEDGPDEFEILLSTGGPAVRIYGTLNGDLEPAEIEMQNQDWFTPWERVPFETDVEVLRGFASTFCFGG